MRKKIACLAFMIFMFSVVLISCGIFGDSLSGKYINKNNDNEYYEFTSTRKATYSLEGISVKGEYEINKTVMLITFEVGGQSTFDALIIDESKDTVYHGDDVFVKDGWLDSGIIDSIGSIFSSIINFLGQHWWKILLGLVILGIVGSIGGKSTKKDEKTEDIENNDKEN